MKKIRQIALCLTMILSFMFVLVGCTQSEKEYELSSYRGQTLDVDGKTVYNKELFYSNSVIQGFPDPQVLDDSARSGYYYLFGTNGKNFNTMRSKNLVEWEDVGPTFFVGKSDEIRRLINNHAWAPEAIYDDQTELYYLFFSARPEETVAESGMGKDENVDQTLAGNVSNLSLYNMYVASSENPAGPYTMINFKDAESCGENKIHNYNTTTGKELTTAEVESGDYAYITKDNKYYQAAFPHYWAKYCLFSPEELSKVIQKNGVGTPISTLPAGYLGTIDPHPYLDPVTNQRYMYFKVENPGYQWNINLVVAMKDWLTPDWTTARYVSVNNYYTVEDWQNNVNQGVSYEYTPCNEGASVLHHKDKNGKDWYYFSYSVNDYTTSTYQVGMAIADNPLGPFRKLTEAEGGLLLCSATTESQTISGAGHHSFANIGSQTYIIYHRHVDYLTGGAVRYTAADEIKWITVKDINGNDMEIPYVNGPTDSLQPLPEAYSGYKNIAEGMNVTSSDDNVETELLTDGLLTVHKSADSTFMGYVREAYITRQTTFTFDFDVARSIRAIMVYNSSYENTVFKNVSKIELVLADGSTRVMRDVLFDMDQYCTFGGQDGSNILYVMSGASAFAEFYDISVKSLKITIDVPHEQEEVGISEIRILGKA